MAKQSLRTWENRTRSISFWWLTAGGVGMLRPAPGTWGSLLGILLAYAMIFLGLPFTAIVGLTAVVNTVSVHLINNMERATGIHDAPEIVIDEVAGQWLAILPLVSLSSSPILFGLAFILFRLFDILKPWPIGWLDRKVDGGIGVMVDDLVAGTFAAIVIWLLLMFDLLDWAI